MKSLLRPRCATCFRTGLLVSGSWLAMAGASLVATPAQAACDEHDAISDELAAIARVSASAFQRQFKALTPLQYQKRLRLLEARRLMASGASKVEAAAFDVGYESPSQFSREYTRMFGAPPKRNLAQLQAIIRADRGTTPKGALTRDVA